MKNNFAKLQNFYVRIPIWYLLDSLYIHFFIALIGEVDIDALVGFWSSNPEWNHFYILVCLN